MKKGGWPAFREILGFSGHDCGMGKWWPFFFWTSSRYPMAYSKQVVKTGVVAPRTLGVLR
jgi:hypothetical protein